MKRSIVSLLVALVASLAPPSADAQAPVRTPRVGLFFTGPPPPRESHRAVEAFRRGLRELGYVEGQTIVLEYRWGAEGKPEQLDGLAADLVRLKVDVIVAQAGTHTAAAKRATSTIPIVTGTAGDPAGGLVASLARPGGNVTGLTTMSPAMTAKSLQLLKEAVPKASRVAALRADAPGPTWREAEAAAKTLGIQLQPLDVRTAEDLERAFQAAAAGRAEGVITIPSPLFGVHRARVAGLALKHRLPSASFETGFADAGGLISYGPSIPENFRRAATYVDKILKGAKPGDLPVEQPTKFELVVNLRTAKALGLTLPRSVLARADRVVE